MHSTNIMHQNNSNNVAPMDDHERGKLFVGGLSWETTQDTLQRYFSRYGEVIDCVVMKNNETGRSRGFGFVTFADPDNVDRALENGPHTLDGRTIDPKPCNPRSMHKPKRTGGYPKVFLGGLPPNVTETDLRNFFSRYGQVMEVVIMYDQEKKKSRGFGFLSFENDPAVDRATQEHFVNLNGKQVEIKKAEPRDGHQGGGQMGDPYQWGSQQGAPMGNGQMGGPPMGGMPMGGANMMQGYQGWGSNNQAPYAGGYGNAGGYNQQWNAPPPQQWGGYNHQATNQGYGAGYDMYASGTAGSTGGYSNWNAAGNWPHNSASTGAAQPDMYSGRPQSGPAAGPPSATAVTGSASKPGSDYSGYGGGYNNYQSYDQTSYNQSRPRSAYGGNDATSQPAYPAF